MPDTIDSLVDYFLPVIATAGRFAAVIQPRVAGPAAKDGVNAWASALTDADIAIQTLFEVATLARYPDAGFYGEEEDNSRNTRYFNPDAATRVCLDPVNGTYLYQQQRDGWDIILDIVRDGRLEAVISHMPARRITYAALRGRGLCVASGEPARLAQFTPLTLPPPRRLVMSYRSPRIAAALAGRIEHFDIVDDDDPARGVDNLNELFTGRLGAFGCEAGDLLDWGAVAFMVAAAGGRASHLDGRACGFFDRFDPRAESDLLVSADPALHDEILAALRGSLRG